MTTSIQLFVPSVTITTGVNDTFQVNDGGGNDTVTITAGTYYATGIGDSSDLLKALEDAVTASLTTSTLTTTLEPVVTSSDVKSTNVLLEWGVNPTAVIWGTFNGDDIGHIDESGTDSYDSDTNPVGWYAPSFPAETFETPVRALGTQFHTVGGQTYTHDRSANVWNDLVLSFGWLDEAHAKASANTADPMRTLQRCWQYWRDGRPVRVYSVAWNESTNAYTAPTANDLLGTYVLDGQHLEALPLTRRGPGVPYYSTQPLLWRQYVAPT